MNGQKAIAKRIKTLELGVATIRVATHWNLICGEMGKPIYLNVHSAVFDGE